MTGANGESRGEVNERPAPGMPLFYKDPQPLDAARHAGKSLKTVTDFAFSRTTNSVPLVLTEFSLASRHYPIVFTGTEPVMATAVLGLRQDENLFVSASGEWLEDHYVPAYVRRYPFIFTESADKQRFILCLDEGSGLLVEGDEQPLYRNGEPTEITTKALELCKTFQGYHQITWEFSAALKNAGLLVEQSADAAMHSGERMFLGGFQVVDEARFMGLSDEMFLEWRRKGWLAFVYFHLASIHNWAILVDRFAQDQTHV